MGYRLEELCKIGSSKRIYLSEYTESGIPFYRGKEIIEKSNGKKISSQLFISLEKYEEIKSKFSIPKIGDILISAVGTLGKSWFVDEENFYFKDGNLIWLYDFNNEIINNRFLYYKLKSKWFENAIDGISIGSTQKAITIEQLKKVELDVPDIKLQNKIVKILDGISIKIEVNNQINDNLSEIGKTYYQNWAESCIEKVAIKEVAEEILDYTKNLNKTVKLINSSDVTRGKFIKFDFVENKDLKGHFKKNFKKYDILYSQIRPRNHHYGYVLFNDTNNYLASTRLMVIRNKKDKISSSLLYFSVISNDAIEDFTVKTESRSGTFPQGNYEDLSSFKIKYKKEQDEITKLLDSILEKIYLNQSETEKLECLRDMLLPKLMNGEIDLDKIEI